MARKIMILLICLGAAVVVSVVVAALILMRQFTGEPVTVSSHELPSPPSGPSQPTLAVVATADSEPFPTAVGFAQALADRLHCAPKCLTQQYTDFEVDCIMRGTGTQLKTLSTTEAKKSAKCLGVDCLVALRIKTAERNIRLDAIILRAKPKPREVSVSISGAETDLPKLQADLANRVVGVLGLKLKPDQSAEIGKPNFSNPATLTFYGKSRMAHTMAEAASLHKKMLEADPGSAFANVQFVSLYVRGPADYLDIRRARAADVLARAEKQWPDNSLVRSLKAPLLVKLYNYEDAEKAALKLVRSDSSFALAHSDLSAVARRRGDADLAVLEGQWYATLWPSNPFAHSALACGYLLTAHNARRGHGYIEMSWQTKRKWKSTLESCVNEARTAVKLFPHCGPAWRTLIITGRELGDPQTRKAFEAACESDPNDLSAYVEYGFSLSPQWGGSRQDEMNVVNLARKRFGANSPQAQIVEAAIMRQYTYNAGYTLGGRYEDDMLLPCAWRDRIGRDLQQSLALVKCRNYVIARQRAKVYTTAKSGFETWHSLIWRNLYGMGCSFCYEDQQDRKALEKACELFAECSRQVPYETSFYVRWGWCLSHMGNSAAAKAKFLKALELDPLNNFAKEKLRYVQ